VAEHAAANIEKLVADFHADVYRYAFWLCRSGIDAEDLTQQAFLQACQKISQLRDPAQAKSWLFAILKNCFLRDRARRQPMPVAGSDFDLEAVPGNVMDTDFDEGQLRVAVDELPDEFRIIVLMFYFEQFSYRDIAEQLQLPIGTVMSRLSRAKGRLRQALLPTDMPASKKPITVKTATASS